MSLLDFYNTASGAGATQDYFTLIGNFQANKAMNIFNRSKYNPIQQPEAAKDLRNEAMAYYETLLGGTEGESNANYSNESQPITDPRLSRLLAKVIGSTLSFSDKKIFMEEAVEEYRATSSTNRDNYVAKVEKLLADAVEKSENTTPNTTTHDQVLRLYMAKLMAGTSDAPTGGLLDFLS